MSKYKYQIPNEYRKDHPIVYLRVVSTPYWIYRPEQKVKELHVGALTWTTNLNYDQNGDPIMPEDDSIIIENNQFGVNFDPSCFEIIPTNTKK